MTAREEHQQPSSTPKQCALDDARVPDDVGEGTYSSRWYDGRPDDRMRGVPEYRGVVMIGCFWSLHAPVIEK